MNRVRGFTAPIPWENVLDHELFHGKPWFVQVAECSAFTIYRNRFTLGVFWSYTMFWRLYRWALRRGKGPGLLATLFPQGVGAWIVQMMRTSGLLGTYAFFFWLILAGSARARINSTGFTRIAATNMVTAAAIIALPVEVSKRWQSMAAFMFMSIFD